MWSLHLYFSYFATNHGNFKGCHWFLGPVFRNVFNNIANPMLLNTVKIFFTLNLQNQFTTSTMYHYHIDTSLTRNHLNHFWCKQNNALLVLHSDWTVVASLPNITIVGKLFLLHFGSFMTNEQGSCYDLEHLFLHWWYRFTQNRVCLKLLIHIYFYVYVWMSMSVCHEYGYL